MPYSKVNQNQRCGFFLKAAAQVSVDFGPQPHVEKKNKCLFFVVFFCKTQPVLVNHRLTSGCQ